MLSVEDVQEILSLKLLGVIPDSQAVLNASNAGIPVILDKSPTPARPIATWSRATWARMPMRFLELGKKGLFSRFFGG
jgi:septum site-determining protein MinD